MITITSNVAPTPTVKPVALGTLPIGSIVLITPHPTIPIDLKQFEKLTESHVRGIVISREYDKSTVLKFFHNDFKEQGVTSFDRLTLVIPLTLKNLELGVEFN